MPTQLFLFLVCLGWTLPSSAQTATRQVFITAGVSGNIDDDRSDPVSGLTTGFGVSFGIESALAGLEVGINVPGWHRQVRPAYRYRWAGTSSRYLQQGQFYENSSSERRRALEVSMVFRRRAEINRALTIVWGMGGAYAHRPYRSVSVTRAVEPDGTLTEVNRHNDRSTRDYLAGVFGLEATLRISPRLAVVPRLRITTFPSLIDDSGLAPRFFVVRPDLALRWTF